MEKPLLLQSIYRVVSFDMQRNHLWMVFCFYKMSSISKKDARLSDNDL